MTVFEKSRYDHRLHWNRTDTIVLAALTCVYAVLAFVNLGSLKAPQTFWTQSAPEESVTLDLGEVRDRFAMLYYCGVSHNDFTVQVSDDGEHWSDPYTATMRQGMCYQWHYLTVPGGSDASFSGVRALSGRYVRITAGSMIVPPNEGGGTTYLRLGEVIFRQLVDAETSDWPVSGEEIPCEWAGHEGGDPESDRFTEGREAADEPGTCEGEPGWFNSTYFDEIYHARTAYEVLHGEGIYEWTHPPLGKLLMSVGVALFGMTPFGWRIAGTMVGIAMLPALYLLIKQFTKKTWMAGLGTLLMALDFMHFTQTRIATIDSYPVLFIILSYFFMLRFIQRDLGARRSGALWKSLPDLSLCGLCFGLSVASKWIGLYAGTGLALLYFWRLTAGIHRAYDDAPEKRRPLRLAALIGILPAGLIALACMSLTERLTDSLFLRIAFSAILAVVCHALGMTLYACFAFGNTPQWRFGWRRWVILSLFCVLFFIAVPAVIYAVSFVPRLAAHHPEGLTGWFSDLINEQTRMYNYHATPGLGMDHPFYSPWYEWPVMRKPMYYASAHYVPAGYSYAIFCFGNPAVWWLGSAAIILMWVLWAPLKIRDRKLLASGEAQGTAAGPLMPGPAFILAAFAAQFLPWVLVPRGTYIYHFFASVPFLILALVYALDLMLKVFEEVSWGIIIGILIVAAAFFVILYPYASGLLTPNWYLNIGQSLISVYHS